ncbi:hypothetical protein G647_08935 [Cladophialophora carrionii CBS 160.54]|uniref:Swi5-dependent recombination DNA repair protein 1 n=1 Tax=Cladophialophora carrionii CBS 160.54 TaxID=1279043 RepID=V9CZ74_9EURO|nr:uncharacterized protein G647_08935 [Cladophialophora carrionii CBS 160.54]ETI19920.1 hypothetical protein G647_08935 [Cladophialophora carrionii CBS 160.54]
MHPAKRRKLDQPQPFQNKPFRSPLRTVSKVQGQPARGQPQNLGTPVGVTPQLTPLVNSADGLNSPQKSHQTTANLHVGSARGKPADLQKQYTALTIRLIQLRQSLENADQAIQIEESGQGAELKRLITKWRTVAQEAADELFADAKERIDGMGGVAAWRRRAEQESRRWNRDEKGLLPQKHEQVANNVASLEDCLATDENKPSQPEEEDDENSFTMETMLQQMNIDLQAIGFDKQLEKWIE